MKIKVNGVIVSNDHKEVYDYFGIEATSPNDVLSALDKAKDKDVEVVISSGGGDVWSASQIYTSLREHKGNVTTKIVSLAASAATVIAMGGNKVIMSPTAEFMIHNASVGGVSGDNRDMSHMAKVLETTNRTVANAYVLKTGRSSEEILELMNKETWLTAQDAKKYGFIDEIMFDESFSLSASVTSMSNTIPVEVIQKFKNDKQLSNPTPEAEKADKESDFLMRKMQSQLNLIKLGGTKS